MKKNTTTIVITFSVLILILAGYQLVYAQRILPRVHVGVVPVGSLTVAEAERVLENHINGLRHQGIVVRVEEKTEEIHLEDINADITPKLLAQAAFELGRSGPWHKKLAQVSAPFKSQEPKVAIVYDADALTEELRTVAQIFDVPGKDIRLYIQGTTVTVLTDTKVGKVIDREAAVAHLQTAIKRLDPSPIQLTFKDDVPHRDPASAAAAKKQAEQMLNGPLRIDYGAEVFTITPVQIGQWIISESQGNALVPAIDEALVSKYVTTLAAQVNIAAQTPVLKIENGKVVQFQPPRSGKAVEEEKTIELLLNALEGRRSNPALSSRVSLPTKITKPVSDVINGPQGIVELIGKATTTFAGSPANRISNIKNGVRFLAGILIAPGEEFSTIKTLGTIDNTSGYLPELVIKENRTVPEFGGGLCQVSTTLFRAVLNSGLPITARKNHSYRVSYYEKDGDGQYIGPGLDATIYDPDPDFKFKNDTGATVLIHAYVIRDTVTFELYGTSDGRTAKIQGPTLLTTIPAGDPIYTETDTLPAGVTKQVETAHAGGSAVATYIVTYPDGTVKKQEFKSFYRRWPARFLVGTAGGTSPSPTPTPPAAVLSQ